MAYKLNVSARADDDTIKATYYYDSFSQELGNRFLEALAIAYKKIEANPYLYSFISSDNVDSLRDIKLKGFPYVIIYEVYEKEVFITSVFNTSQKPL